MICGFVVPSPAGRLNAFADWFLNRPSRQVYFFFLRPSFFLSRIILFNHQGYIFIVIFIHGPLTLFLVAG